MKADDYECIDVTGLDSLIKGEVFSSRQGKRRVVYEDYLYLLEGMLRRKNYLTGWVNPDGSAKSRVKPAMPRLWLSRRAFRDAADCYIGLHDTLVRLDNFCDPDVRIRTGSVIPVADKGSYEEDISFSALLDTLGLVPVVPERIDYSCSVGDMGRAFSNLAKTTRSADWVLIPDERDDSIEYRSVYMEKKDDGQTETFYDGWYRLGIDTMYSVTCTPSSGSVWEFRGTYSCKFRRGWAKSGIVALQFITAVDGGFSTERGKWWADYVLLPLVVTSDGMLKFDGFNREGLVKKVLGYHGEPYISSPTTSDSDECYSASVSVRLLGLIVDHDFESKSRQAS